MTNKTVPTKIKVTDFLKTVSPKRADEAQILIKIMQDISKQPPVMWGPSIIGFGSVHYSYDTGREGDMPALGFSPRKTAITIYFGEGFDRYNQQLKSLGKYKTSVSCLYVNKLEDINLEVLQKMLQESYKVSQNNQPKPTTVNEYVESLPKESVKQFNNLRTLIKQQLPKANEVLSYGIVGYKVDEKRAKVFIAGWHDHVSVYPAPKNKDLSKELKPYLKSKGTLWFGLEEELPKTLIKKVIKELVLQ